MPFEWTVNPYRGAAPTPASTASPAVTHAYLDLDTGIGFDTQIAVKTNAPELLRRQVASPSWQGAHIAMRARTWTATSGRRAATG